MRNTMKERPLTGFDLQLAGTNVPSKVTVMSRHIAARWTNTMPLQSEHGLYCPTCQTCQLRNVKKKEGFGKVQGPFVGRCFLHSGDC